MSYNTKNPYEKALLSEKIKWIMDNEKICKVEVIKFVRSLTQNRALHLFFKWLSIEFNMLGITFNYTGLKGTEMETPYTPTLIKETLWKPLQKTLFDIDSTTELETSQINIILDVLIKFFADRSVLISFPNKFDKLKEEMEKYNKQN